MWQIYNLVFMQVHQQLEGLEALIPCWSLVVLSGSLLKVAEGDECKQGQDLVLLYIYIYIYIYIYKGLLFNIKTFICLKSKLHCRIAGLHFHVPEARN
jgi:hypothetical protein